MKCYFFSLGICSIFSLISMEPYNFSVAQPTGLNTHRASTFSSTGIPIDNSKNVIKETINNIKDAQIAEIDINEIHRKIDEYHLGITKNTWCKRIVGACYSFYKSKILTDEQVNREMMCIESYVPGNNKEVVLEKLEKQHWYVNYLLQASLHSKIKEIENVKGSTVDTLYNPTTQDGFQRMVHIRALQKYFDEARIKRSLFGGVSMGQLGDIHWIILYGHQKNIDRMNFDMSLDGKYLRSISEDKSETIIWEMEQGIKTNFSGEEACFADIEWTNSQHAGSSRFCVVDKTDNYFAEIFTPLIRIGENNPPSNMAELYGRRKMPITIEKNEPAVILFTRPKETSYLCQKAYYNSIFDPNTVSELTALHKSKSFEAIQGYPKNNLEKRIRDRIKELELTAKL